MPKKKQEEFGDKVKKTINTTADKAKAAFEKAVDYGSKQLGEAVDFTERQAKLASIAVDIEAEKVKMGKEFLSLGKALYDEYQKQNADPMSSKIVADICKKLDTMKTKIEKLEKEKESMKKQK